MQLARLTGTNRISEEYGLLNENSAAIEQAVEEGGTATQQVQTNLDAHEAATSAHTADHISYAGNVPATNVQEAIDSIDERVDNIVAQSGDDITELVDARQPAVGPAYPVLGARLDDVDTKFGNKVEKGELVVTARDFGAEGDDSNDDTDAIEASLLAASGKSWILPDGIYRVTREISLTDPPKQIIFNGTIKAANGFPVGATRHVIMLTGNDMDINVRVDCNGNGIGALRVNGDNNRIRADVKNIIAIPLAGGNNFQNAIYLQGSHNDVDVYGENMLHGTAGPSDAVPRLMSIDLGSQYNTIRARGHNIDLGLVINSPNNTIDYLDLDGGESGGNWNGVYALTPAQNTRINNAIFNNWHHQAITWLSKGLVVNSFIATDCSAFLLSLQNGSDVTMHSVQVRNEMDENALLLWLRPENILSENITIRNVTMVMGCSSDNTGAIVQAFAGTLNNFSLSDFDITIKYTTGKTTALGVHVRGDKVDYRNGKITVIDTTESLSNTSVFNFSLPAALDTAKVSFWSDIDLVAIGQQAVRIINAIQEPVVVRASRAFVHIGPYLTNQDAANTYPVEVWSSQLPTAGTWQRNSVVNNIARSAGGTMGWVCVVSGSPGTWKTFGPIAT